MLLTGPFAKTLSRAPIFEETVKTSAVHEDIRAVKDPKTPCLIAICLNAVGIRRIVPNCTCGVRGEWNKSVWIGLIICRLLLYCAHEDVGSTRELVIVKRRVLSSGTIQPARPFRAFNKEASGHSLAFLAYIPQIWLQILTFRCIYQSDPCFPSQDHDQPPNPMYSQDRCWPGM